MPLQHVVGLGLPPRYPGCPTGQKPSLFCSAMVPQNEGCMSVVVLCVVWVVLICLCCRWREYFFLGDTQWPLETAVGRICLPVVRNGPVTEPII